MSGEDFVFAGEPVAERRSRGPSDRTSRRPFEGDLRADHRFERAVFWRGAAITVGVVALVVLRELLM